MWQLPAGVSKQRAPIPRPAGEASQPKHRVMTIKDHSGSDVHIVWMGVSRHELPPFPFSVYVLDSATKTVKDPDLPTSFIQWIDCTGAIHNSDMRCHFNIHRGGFDNAMACIAHQRQESIHRNANAIRPTLLREWTRLAERDFQGFLLIIDGDDWMQNGLVSVEYDRPPPDREQTRRSGLVYWDSEECVTCAGQRRPLKEMLAEYWIKAGGIWRQGDLGRRNQGGVSPALYPAVDPSAHHDVEHVHAVLDDLSSEESDESDGGNADAEEIEDFWPVYAFDTPGLFSASAENSPHLRSEEYNDTVGWRTTSIWDSRLSKNRPEFNYTLYLATSCDPNPAHGLPFSAHGLFNTLNWGPLQDAAWTLDIVRNVPDMSSAFYHYTHEAPRRVLSKTTRKQECIRMILSHIVGAMLPEELLQHIESIVVPPAYPDHPYISGRGLQHMFLFLEGRNMFTGPHIIYSSIRRSSTSGVAIDSPLHSYPNRWGAEDQTLRVFYYQFWRRVSRELHTIWSIGSPRYEAESLPMVTLRMDFPAVCDTHTQWGDPSEDSPVITFYLTNHSERPITIHLLPMFSRELFCEALNVDDLTDDVQLPTTNYTQWYSRPYWPARWHSWSEEDTNCLLRPIGQEVSLLKTLMPGQPTSIYTKLIEPGYHRPVWWSTLQTPGLLRHAHEYLIRLKEGLTIPRWTYGVTGALKGPYNLPPLVINAENEVRFTFRVPDPPSVQSSDAGSDASGASSDSDEAP